MQNIIEKHLNKDEQILSNFKPDLNKKFGSKDGLLLLIGLFFVIWSFALLIQAMTKNDTMTNSTWLYVLFVVFSIYMLIGRFFVKTDRKKRIAYYITNKRLFRVTKTLSGKEKVEYVDIKDTDKLEVDGTPPDSCTIFFKNQTFCYTNLLANTGMGFDAKFNSFWDVRRANQICKTIIDAKQQVEAEEIAAVKEQIARVKQAQEEAERARRRGENNPGL